MKSKYRWILGVVSILIVTAVGIGFIIYGGKQISKKENVSNTPLSETKFDDSELNMPKLKPITAQITPPKPPEDTKKITIPVPEKPLDTSKFNLDIPVLMYHHIDPIPADQAGDAIATGLRVGPETFDLQMKTLKEKGYSTLHIDDYIQIVYGYKKAPQKSVLITIDDGFLDNYKVAFPILKKYNLIGNFAIITNVLSTREYMSLENVKEIHKAGMGIMSHTELHCSLAPRTTVDGVRVYGENTASTTYEPCPEFTFGGTLSKGQVEYELKKSKEFLEKELNTEIRSIVYPFGNYNKTTIELAEKTGYTFGFTTKYELNPLTNDTTLLELPRISVPGQQTTELKGFFYGLE
jgi:peptidoglycan/xylan/chitin deacetylase (PgdA/CDA1 family)